MSNWTHVLATFQIGGESPVNPLDWDTLVGKPVRTVTTLEDWAKARKGEPGWLPTGSEGSLGRRVVTITWDDAEDYYQYLVTVYGGLRDHEDPNAIVKWFTEVCKRVKTFKDGSFDIAQAVCDVDNLLNGHLVARYDRETEEVEVIGEKQ